MAAVTVLIAPAMVIVRERRSDRTAEQSASQDGLGVQPVHARRRARRRLLVELTCYAIVWLGGILLLLWTGKLLWRSWPSGSHGIRIDAAVFGAWVLAIFVLIVAIDYALSVWCWPDPRDALIIALINAYATAALGDTPYQTPSSTQPATCDLPWKRDRKARLALARQLQSAARDIERDMQRIAPRGLPEVRGWLRDYGRRVAAGFRLHARAVLLGGEQDERLAPALAAGLVATARGQWDELAHAEPTPLRQRLMLLILQRGTVVVALVIAGFWVPSLFSDAQTQAQVRGAFLAAALLALTAPRDAIRELRDKARDALSPKK